MISSSSRLITFTLSRSTRPAANACPRAGTSSTVNIANPTIMAEVYSVHVTANDISTLVNGFCLVSRTGAAIPAAPAGA